MSAELFLIHTEFLENEEVFFQKLRGVSEARKKKVEACRAKEDKLRSLAGGLLLEELLRQHFYSPQKLIQDEKGKLMLEGEEAFYFNLSHSGDYAACVIAEGPVGVDIQQYRPVKDGLAKRFFQAQEANQLRQTRGRAREELFFRYWTAKESYIKLTGEGLRQGFNSFGINLQEGRVEDPNRPEREIYLKEYCCLPGYAITVAACEDKFSRFVKKIFYRI